MKRSITIFLTSIVIGFASTVWAGPAEEIAQIAGPRLKALEDGNLDAYIAAFADNAVFQSSLSPFRIEGKPAIRAYFANLFQMNPKRRVTPRPPVMRVYNDDLVVQNSYGDFHVTDEQGQVSTRFLRSSVIWARIDGRWQIVDQHTSRVPEAR